MRKCFVAIVTKSRRTETSVPLYCSKATPTSFFNIIYPGSKTAPFMALYLSPGLNQNHFRNYSCDDCALNRRSG